MRNPRHRFKQNLLQQFDRLWYQLFTSNLHLDFALRQQPPQFKVRNLSKSCSSPFLFNLMNSREFKSWTIQVSQIVMNVESFFDSRLDWRN
jgi:hypothetical protein